jgi:hypothetical protein
MTTHQVFTYWPSTVTRAIRKWWLRRQLADIGYALAHIQAQRENDRHVERVLMGRQAVIQSDIRNI